MNRRTLFWVLTITMIVLDQVVKNWVRMLIPPGGSFSGKPWPGVFELTLVYNQGIAFGQLQGYGAVLAPIAIAISGGAVWWSWKHPQESAWKHVTTALLASGALGNLYDRLFNPRGVTDMFWMRFIKFPVFNVADACISVAATMLIVHWLIESFNPAHRSKAPESEPAIETLEPSSE